MVSDSPDAESLSKELDQVFQRHNELVVRDPAMAAALCINMADSLRDKFGVGVDAEEIDDGQWMVEFGDADAAGFVGFDRDAETGEMTGSDFPEEMEVSGRARY